MFTFNSITSDQMNLGVTDVRRAIVPATEANLLSASTARGGYLAGGRLGMRRIEIDVNLTGSSQADAMTQVHALAEWLFTNFEPKALVLDDEPNISYYAVLDGQTDLTRVGTFGSGTITFVCPDPYGYEALEYQDSLVQGENTLVIGGNQPTYPYFLWEFFADATFAEVQNMTTGEFVRVGVPANSTDTAATPDTPDDPYVLKWNDDMTSTFPGDWTSSALDTVGVSNADDHGTNPMEMDGDDDPPTKYVVADPGTGTGWHGPTMTRAVSGAPVDFRVQAQVELDKWTTFNTIGMVNIMLIDSTDDTVFAFIGLINNDTAKNACWLHVWVKDSAPNGSTGLPANYIYYGPYPGDVYRWTDIYASLFASLYISRKDDVWSFGVEQPAKHISDIWSWVDEAGVASAYTLDKVGIQLLEYGAFGGPTYHSILNVKAEEITDNSNPFYFKQGDQIIFDMAEGNVLLNGGPMSNIIGYDGRPIPVNALIDIDSTFFAVNPGNNNVGLFTDAYDDFYETGISGAIVYWRDRWL